jgi:hypothetical protein
MKLDWWTRGQMKVNESFRENMYVTLQHKTSLLGQILESEILVLCDSVLQELSTNIHGFDIIHYHLTEIWPFECSDY